MNFRKIRGKIVITAGILAMTALPQGVFATECIQTQNDGNFCGTQQNRTVCMSLFSCENRTDSGTHIGNASENYSFHQLRRCCRYPKYLQNWHWYPDFDIPQDDENEAPDTNTGGENAENENIVQPGGSTDAGGTGNGSAENGTPVQPDNNAGSGADNGNTENMNPTQPDNSVGGTNGTDSDTGTGSTGTGNTGDSAGTGSSAQQGSYTSQVIRLVNEERSAQGLSALSYDAELTELAQLKAEDMAKNGYFSHQSPTYGSAFDMMKAAGVTYRSAGENIARGQKTASAVMNSWMKSQGHRENILSTSYTSIGVGYAVDRSGRACWVQMFRG